MGPLIRFDVRVLLLLWCLLGISPLAFADEATDRAAIEAAAQAWTEAFNARDVDALLALSTEDVVLMDPRISPVSGRAAARRAVLQAFTTASSAVTTATKEISIAGDIAWRMSALDHTSTRLEAMSRGQSLEIWKRAGGAWRLHRHMSSSLLARPKLFPSPPPSEPVLNAPRS